MAFATWLAAVPLVVMGGLVTTMRAGMAEDGWLKPEGHWLWLYPFEKRMVSAGRFVEHHHREFGTLVGILAIATLVAVLCCKSGRTALWAALLGLTTVIIQGVIGGTRVLDNSPQLAFLHGVLGQVVFGVLAGVAVVLSTRWLRFPMAQARAHASLLPAAWLVLGALLMQVTLGAWYRHGHGHNAIALHGFGAILVVVLGIRWSKLLKQAAAEPEQPAEASHHLRRSALWFTAFLHSQWVLGGLALYALFAQSDGMGGEHISNHEIVFSTLHVTIGAMLTAATVHAFLWSHRLRRKHPSTSAGR